jgi:hypothetical protein
MLERRPAGACAASAAAIAATICARSPNASKWTRKNSHHGLETRAADYARRRVERKIGCVWGAQFWTEVARSERFELPALGIEIRCSIQLSYERVRSADYQTWPGRASGGMSVAGMPPAVLADIGRRAPAAEDGGGTIIIGEGAGLQAGPVIVQVADRVGQPPIVQMMPIMAGVCQVRGQRRGGEEGSGNEKLRFGHFDSPEVPLEQ